MKLRIFKRTNYRKLYKVQNEVLKIKLVVRSKCHRLEKNEAKEFNGNDHKLRKRNRIIELLMLS